MTQGWYAPNMASFGNCFGTACSLVATVCACVAVGVEVGAGVGLEGSEVLLVLVVVVLVLVNAVVDLAGAKGAAKPGGRPNSSVGQPGGLDPVILDMSR